MPDGVNLLELIGRKECELEAYRRELREAHERLAELERELGQLQGEVTA